MKIILTVILAVAAFVALHIPKLKKKRGIVLAAYALGMVLFFVVYNMRTLDHIVRFSHPSNQSMYQPEFFENGEYVDAFLDEYLTGKTVYTPDDAYTVSDSIDVNDTDSENFDSEGNYWLYHYYHAVNMWQYLDFNKAVVVKDSALNDVVLTDEQKKHYEDLGYANDMMRYTFPLTPYNGEWGNGFYYYWFYNSFIGESHVYICTEGLMDSEEIVVIWQHEGGHDNDNYYIASKEFFDREIMR